MSTDTPKNGTDKPAIPIPAKQDPALNIGLRGDRLYEVDSLHKWFAIASLLLFIFTIWMILFDYNREWKQHQRAYTQIRIERTLAERNNAANSIDRTQFEALQIQLAESQSELEQNETEVERVQSIINDLNADFYAADQNFRFARATYDVEKYDYEEALAARTSNAETLKQRADATLDEINQFGERVDALTLEIRDAEMELDAIIGTRDSIQSEIDLSLAEYNRIDTVLNTLDPGFVVTSFRNAPVLDFLNPSEKISQILVTNLYNEHPFMQIPRVDRCTTCHLGIDQPSFIDAPAPFTAHPDLDKYLANNSPHPIGQFGCTTCHSGLDRAVEFARAGHTPVDLAQQSEWEEKYSWHEQHYLETPMIPMSRIEATCLKCHTGGGDVPQAPALNKGRDLIRMYGCFGCHRIPGYENVRKVGPDLTTIASKLDKEWVHKWLREPKSFKSEARMPQFWGVSNNNGPEYRSRNIAEITAITEFLFSKSKDNPLPPARKGGSEERGKELVETIGCFGCHSIGPIDEDQERTQHRRRFGYNLASQGSKTDLKWIYNWVRNPQAVWHETLMPSLRLTTSEGADVATYLSSLTNPDFENQDFPEATEAALDEVALELLRASSTGIEARNQLGTMSLQEKNLYTGERLVSRYG